MDRNLAVASLRDSWRGAGVCDGDVLLLHSNASRTLKAIRRAGGVADPALILESFIAAVGQSGTLLLPLFNFDFTAGAPFDIRSTPSHMGILTELGRTWNGAVRTGHPIYSFAVIGAKAAEFEGVDNVSAYGPDSPFGVLHALQGKIAVLDLPDNGSMTFYHYVEQAHDADWRFHKSFIGQYTDARGSSSQRSYSIFVRDLDRGVVTQVDPMGSSLWKCGAYTGNQPGEGKGLRVIGAERMFDEVSVVIKEGRARGLLYECS